MIEIDRADGGVISNGVYIYPLRGLCFAASSHRGYPRRRRLRFPGLPRRPKRQLGRRDDVDPVSVVNSLGEMGNGR